MTDSEWNPLGIRSESESLPSTPTRPVPKKDLTVVYSLSYRDMCRPAAKTI